MYYVIFGLLLAAVFAALQVFLCRKTEKRIIRLIPLFLTAVIFALLVLLMTEPVSAALAKHIGWGIFALLVYFTIGAVGSALGTAAGWLTFIFMKRKKWGKKDVY